MPDGPLSKQLAEDRLGEPIDPWLASRRESGLSWRTIARELHEATGGRVDFSPVTIRSWSDEPARTRAAS